MAPGSSVSGACPHDSLISKPSPYAAEAGYKQPPPSKLLAATLPSGRVPKSSETKSSTSSTHPIPGAFLAPLVLPGDDLAYDPKCPPQSLRSFIQEKARNPMTRKRSTIYVIGPPAVAKEVNFVDSWIHPSAEGAAKSTKLPEAEDIVSSLSAFYYPIPVKLYTEPLTFTAWSDDPKPKSKNKSKTKASPTPPQYIGLASTTSCTRIRCRPCPPTSPTSASPPIFPMQLHLSDLLDTLPPLLPADAYSILLLTHHDIYESPSDDFVCGRAYGGSRIAVVSSARYRPDLDQAHGVDASHAWPASHCKAYVESLCNAASSSSSSRAKPRRIPPSQDGEEEDEQQPPIPPTSPLSLALQAFKSPPSPISPLSSPAHYALHLHRLHRTSAHELGHTLGLDHCVYHACLMQGTASLAEDARQPPVFCAVCEGKVEWAVGGEFLGGERLRGERAREERLVRECERWGSGEGGGGWRAMGAWVRGRMEQGGIGAEEGGDGEGGVGVGARSGKGKRKRMVEGREVGVGVGVDDEGGIEIVDLT
ncbi:MAG: hypothetical protein Q9160_003198 [Pyrenula sp. 1 TL-2023]